MSGQCLNVGQKRVRHDHAELSEREQVDTKEIASF